MVSRVVLGAVLMVATTLILAFVAITEPARMAETEAGFEGRSIEAGAALYESNCAVCHGLRGQGVMAPPLNTPEMFNGTRLAEVGWAGTLEDYIHGTIASGRPLPSAGSTYPKRMPTWSREFGGPLRADQVRNLVDFILNWEEAALAGAPADAAAAMEEAGIGADLKSPALPPGDAANGEQLAVTLGCTACHIDTEVGPAWMADKDPNGEGIGLRAAARITAPDYAGAATTLEAYLRESIVRTNDYIVEGYQPDVMPKVYGDTLPVQEAADLIAYLMSLK